MQQPVPTRIALRRTPAALGAVVAVWGAGAVPASAQDAGQARSSSLAPTFAAEEAYVETRGRAVGENGGELITRLSPGLRLSSRSGRIQGSLDYAADLIYRSGHEDTKGGEVQHALSAAFVAEAVPNRAFVEARATVSQQSISAFGQQSVDGLQDNPNRTEVASVSVSPYLRGNLGTLADYELRADAGLTRTRHSTADSTNTGGSFVLKSARGGSMFGWSLLATQQRVDFKETGTTDNARLNATVSVTPMPELRLSASAGRESVDEGNGTEKRTLNTNGVGLQWTPTARTNLSIDAEERYFGHSNRVAFSHRMPRSIWTYSLTRDATGGSATSRPVTLYQLLYEQAASQYPDPAVREQAVLDFLRTAGRDPNEIIGAGFVNSAISLQRRQDLSFAWLGLRTTFTVNAFTSDVRLLDSTASTDPAAGEAVRQHGYSATLTHRLTPVSSINFTGSRQMTFDTPTRAGNDLKSAGISLISQLGQRTSGQLGARYTVFNSPTDPYRESSLTGSLSLRF